MRQFELLNYTKNNVTPPTLINAPRISNQLTFCLKNMTAGGIISIGTMAIMVEATPVAAYFTANKEKETLFYKTVG